MGTPGPQTGFSAKLYRNTGTVATPTWSEIAEIGDLSLNGMERSVAELKRRGKKFTKGLPSLINLMTVEFRFHSGLDGTNFDALNAAFFSGVVSEYAVMSGDITTSGEEGLRLPAFVSSFPWNQPLEDVIGHDMVLTLGYMVESTVEVDPNWYAVT
jgi:hypothetical protein